jgi:uncharacterized protein
MDLLRSRTFWLDMGRLQLGLFLFGLAVALMLEARIGLDPWSAFHEALSVRSELSFGRISQGVGLVLIAFSSLVLAVRPGIATVCNMLIIGPWVDALRPHVGFAVGDMTGTIQFVGGILVMGIGTAVYIGASLGAGPRDGLAMGLSRRIGRSLRASRIGVEVTVLGAAAMLDRAGYPHLRAAHGSHDASELEAVRRVQRPLASLSTLRRDATPRRWSGLRQAADR